jgi:hypothetical protein
MTYFVYALCDPVSASVRYVGITRQTLKLRLKSHVAAARKGKGQYVSRWIATILAAGLRPTIVKVETTNDYFREKFWIQHYKTNGAKLTNLTDGCEQTPGWSHSKEARAKISEAGKKHYKNIAGKRFGRWTVLSLASHSPVKWLCECSCAAKTQRTVRSLGLLFGGSKSCGCLSRELSAKRCANRTKHGMWRASEFHTWQSMLSKCSNPQCNRYIGNKVSVCKRWRASFLNFLKDMGHRPKGHCLGRRNQKMGFSPRNCVWETLSQKQKRAMACK